MTERARLIELIILLQHDAAWFADRARQLRELGLVNSAIACQQRAAIYSRKARAKFETLHYRHFPAHIALHGDK